MSKPVWTWGSRLDEIDHEELDQFIANETSSEPSSTEVLVRLYDEATAKQRELIDKVTIAITGWSVESLLNNSQPEQESENDNDER